jgi:benzoate/toluate 1,2-dioxygenase reductase subunit
MLSMLDRLRLVRPAPPIRLVFGAVRPSELFHLDELEARTSFMENLAVRVVVEQGADGTRLAAGNPVSTLTEADAPRGAVAYLCGPPGMVRAATERLSEYGLSADDIRAENFLAS